MNDNNNESPPDSKIGGALQKTFSRILERIYDEAISPRLRARAKTDERITEARTDGQVERIKKMDEIALMREVRDLRAYDNLENIVNKAEEFIPDNVKTENLEVPQEDWMTSWMEYAGRVSEEKMQSLWAGILAGKSQNPDSFPLRTLTILRDMDKNTAEQFIAFCQFITDPVYDFGAMTPLIYDVRHDVYKNQKLSYELLHDMVSRGLLTQWSHATLSESKERLFSYRGEHIILELKYYEELKRYSMELGEVSLTSAGKDLFSLVRKSHEAKNREFWEYVKEKWATDGLKPRIINAETVNSQISLKKLLKDN